LIWDVVLDGFQSVGNVYRLLVVAATVLHSVEGFLLVEGETGRECHRLPRYGASAAPDEIVRLMPGVTLEQIAELTLRPLAERRIRYLQKLVNPPDPVSAAECTQYVRAMLLRLSKAGTVGNQIAALKALYDVALGELEREPQKPSTGAVVDLGKLSAAFRVSSFEESKE
jgi:hypothetical protein